MKRIYLAAAALAALSAAMPAAAQTSYTDKATFLAAAGSTQTETFGTSPVGQFTGPGSTFAATFDGFSIAGNDGGNFVGIATGSVASSGDDFAIPVAFTGQNFLAWGNIAGGIMSMTINFNAATTAFGFDWFNTDFSDSYSINTPGGTIFNTPPFTLASNSATSGFFGLISATPFTSIVITNNETGGYMSTEGMDNFVTNGVGSVNPGVPEPATWAMMIGGFGAIGASMRRRKVSVRFA